MALRTRPGAQPGGIRSPGGIRRDQDRRACPVWGARRTTCASGRPPAHEAHPCGREAGTRRPGNPVPGLFLTSFSAMVVVKGGRCRRWWFMDSTQRRARWMFGSGSCRFSRVPESAPRHDRGLIGGLGIGLDSDCRAGRGQEGSRDTNGECEASSSDAHESPP